jgi:hypothetical protein
LKEVLRSEAGIELIMEDNARPEKQKRKPGVSGSSWGQLEQGKVELGHTHGLGTGGNKVPYQQY